MEITNKTTKPLQIPLPGGKKLFLAPGKTGQITPKALERPAVAELIESGDLESSESAKSKTKTPSVGKSGSGASGAKSTGAIRQSGDR